MIIFSYVGFELLVKLNADTYNPQKDIPKAIRTTIIFTIIIYSLLGYVYSYAMFKLENKETKTSQDKNDINDKNDKNTINKIKVGASNFVQSTKIIIEDTEHTEAPLTFAMEILTKTKKINHLVSFGGMIFTATTTLLMMLSASKLLAGQIDLSTNNKIKKMNPLNIVLYGVLILSASNINIENSTIIANICIILLMIVVSYAVIKINTKNTNNI